MVTYDMLVERLQGVKETDKTLEVLQKAYPNDWMEVRDELIKADYKDYFEGEDDSFEGKKYHAMDINQKEVYHLLKAMMWADNELNQPLKNFIRDYGDCYDTRQIDFIELSDVIFDITEHLSIKHN